ncbi:NmrA family NAD(P)-binding protein [Streptomyces sp. NBC_00316]|uniref:NmrA family NAD(P)-binding protein n=1 Tax=Streptomyces sp. NBC_00316 TaxID=2975710 RepID=UPI002E290DA5|nr:NAD(P)H-binding protein [Streptomyces sp. NBC_00316]
MAHRHSTPSPHTALTLVTGAAGGVGRMVVERLRGDGLPVRAFVHRDDERAAELRALGADIAVGDLTRAADLVRALDGCRRMYFGLGVSSHYLEATMTAAAAALDQGRLEIFVNMSQLTVSQMTLAGSGESRQQRQHWLAEQALNWSGLPVTHIRPTVFMENPIFQMIMAADIARDSTIRLPFGSGRTSPVATQDVAEVVATILAAPETHAGRTYGLTGDRSRDMTAIAQELTDALGRTITYVDVPHEEWVRTRLTPLGLPDHIGEHLAKMARLHAENRYDRATDDVELITGHSPLRFSDFVRARSAAFTGDDARAR